MLSRAKGFFNKLKDRLPTSRAKARLVVHADLIGSAKSQLAKAVMEGMTHALSQKDGLLHTMEKLWWKAQVAKWETIWRMLNEACADLSDFRNLSDLDKIGDAAFKLYEQLIKSDTILCAVSSWSLRGEALRWRGVGALTFSLYRHCVLSKLYESLPRVEKERKNTPISGIKDMKEG